jgi:hypothetical protein
MPVTPAEKSPATDPVEDMEQCFRRLESQWAAETRLLSDPGKIMGHPAMRAIVALGKGVVPLILRQLREQPSLLVWALPEIAGENLMPPKKEDGFTKWDVGAQIEAWQRWGREKGLV